jgi:hypothetical protein
VTPPTVGEAEVPPPTVEEADAAEELKADGWTRVHEDYTKCERPEGEWPFDADLAECKFHALLAGRAYISYYAEENKCFTAKTCDSPTGTSWAWKSYAAPTDAPRKLDVGTWVPYTSEHSKCMHDGEYPYPVGDRAECEFRAKHEGKTFISYYEEEGLCVTHEVCVLKENTGWPWIVYNMPTDTASEDLPIDTASEGMPTNATSEGMPSEDEAIEEADKEALTKQYLAEVKTLEYTEELADHLPALEELAELAE